MQNDIYHEPGQWQRVRRDYPCPICGKPDYCVVTASGTAVICMRIQAGSVKETRNGGFLHRIKGGLPPRYCHLTKPPPGRDFGGFQKGYSTAINPARLSYLAHSLGVSVESLRRLGVGWSVESHAWTFPMRDVSGMVRGFRLRLEDGRKLAVRGGREGLFIPELGELPPGIDGGTGQLLITEGPTDCAALLDLGFVAVGRPSCTGGVALLVELVTNWTPVGVVVVADADPPGQRGAEALASALLPYAKALRVILPPVGVKDAREWKRSGGTRGSVLEAIEAAKVRRLAYQGRLIGKGVANAV